MRSRVGASTPTSSETHLLACGLPPQTKLYGRYNVLWSDDNRESSVTRRNNTAYVFVHDQLPLMPSKPEGHEQLQRPIVSSEILAAERCRLLELHRTDNCRDPLRQDRQQRHGSKAASRARRYLQITCPRTFTGP